MTRLPNDRIKVVCYFPSFDGLFLESAFLDLCVHARNLFYNWFSANKVSRVKLHIYECLKSQENPTEIITVNNFPFLNRNSTFNDVANFPNFYDKVLVGCYPDSALIPANSDYDG